MTASDALWAAVTALGGIVWQSQNARIAALEIANKERGTADQTLREAVVKLTVTVEHLSKQVETLTRHQGSSSESGKSFTTVTG